MLTRRSLIQHGAFGGLVLSMPQVSRAAVPETDVTFLVINDVHTCDTGNGPGPNCEMQGKTDANLLRHIRALNAIEKATWPDEIAGKPTGFISAGQPVSRPRGIVVCGDMTDNGGGQTKELSIGPQLAQFARRYRQSDEPGHVHFPVYTGLGNHDLDMDGPLRDIDRYRDQLRDYVRINHKRSAFSRPAVPVDNYHEASDNYSWNWEGLHLIQAQRYAGDNTRGTYSSLEWIRQDLATYAADGRPVIIFQHYGWDNFSTQRWDPLKVTYNNTGTGPAHWWSDAEREQLFAVLQGYNVIGIFHGHEHDAIMAYNVNGIDIFKAKAAFMGGFCLVRVTNDRVEVAIGEASDNDGTVRFDLAFSRALPAG